MRDFLMHTYARQNVTFTHGEGAWLWDTAGQRYLDAVSGVAVNSLGHAHPRLTEALCNQSRRLMHVSNLYRIEEQQALGERLCTLAEMERVFFCNSGAEANEAAIKVARLYGHQRGVAIPRIIVMDGSFHGRTLATLTATGNAKIQAGFEPLVEGFLRAPYDDLDAVRALGAVHADVVAVLVEPVQGEGGIRIPSTDYLPGLRQLCDDRGWLLMLDEVQTGVGRTGEWFAFQHTGVKPDVMALAKGLGGGFPIGACVARGAAAETFAPGNHGSTFGGNPLACAAATAVLESITTEDLRGNAARIGNYLYTGLNEALGSLAGVVAVRGHGLMLGVELDRPCATLVARALEQKLLINVTANSVIRLLPPLVLDREQADQIIAILAPLVREFLSA
ncbi:MAG: acetylornithine transaminase [Thiotrichales bacterium]